MDADIVIINTAFVNPTCTGCTSIIRVETNVHVASVSINLNISIVS